MKFHQLKNQASNLSVRNKGKNKRNVAGKFNCKDHNMSFSESLDFDAFDDLSMRNLLFGAGSKLLNYKDS